MKRWPTGLAGRIPSTAIAVMAALTLATAACDGGDSGGAADAGRDTIRPTDIGVDTGETDPDTGGADRVDTRVVVHIDSGAPVGEGDAEPDSDWTDENCFNGLDDDGDGDVDLMDRDCSTSLAGGEICDNGHDDTGDGRVDCDDPQCKESKVCDTTPKTCNVMYVCLIEVGCDCTLGIDCPDGDGTNPCMQTCLGDQGCYDGCLSTLAPDLQIAWGAWEQCLSASCPDAADDAFEACYVGQCLDEYAGCFFGCVDTKPPSKDLAATKAAFVSCATTQCDGVQTQAELTSCTNDKCTEEATQCMYGGTYTCEEGYFGCAVDCPAGDWECSNTCLESLSSQGAYDLLTWDACRRGLCDADDDGESDGSGCLVASYFACSDMMGTCGPKWLGAEACNATVDCVIGCGGFDASAGTCVDGCLANMSKGELGAVSTVFSCAVAACGTTADAITPACVVDVLATECGAEAAICGYVPSQAEDCTNAADDDGDGMIDCDDGDCATDTACAPSEVCDNGIDDDSDENTDCDDGDCADHPACQ